MAADILIISLIASYCIFLIYKARICSAYVYSWKVNACKRECSVHLDMFTVGNY